MDFKRRWKSWFPVSWRDTGETALILAAAVGICVFLHRLDESGSYASMVFVLAVMCVARSTSGYLYGILASFFGVVATNYTFTYPYNAFNFTISGYPLTFVVMLAVSILTSTLTTQAKDHERMRRETEKEMLRANLLRAVSHDIRTPLTAILGATSAVLEGGDRITPAARRELLTHVQEECRWLINMVENLLSITRMSNESTLLTRQPEVVEEVVGGAVQKFRRSYPGIRIVVRPPERFAVVEMDATLMEQVLINLMENAVIHGKNTTSITISFARRPGQVDILVSDDGGGVDPRIIDRVLDDAFSQIRQERTDTKRNMGIGLSVCRSIVAAHGGSMVVRNTEQGAEFTVTLPLQQEEYDVQGQDTDC